MKVLVVAAHPDDEVLGCGGTIARHVAKGDEVSLLILTDGVGARAVDGEWVRLSCDRKQRSTALSRSAAILLGAGNVRQATLPDNQLDTVPLLRVVQLVDDSVGASDVVYTHHAGDLNIDHQITHQAVMTACRPMPGSTVKAIYAFEVPSSTEWASDQSFRPSYFVDISSTLDKKMEALKAYDEEMRDFPHPRSYEAVEALAKWRGASVGLQAAEAFMTLRRIEA
jgi:N-acetylglucosamine malate deacetylase 1